MTQNIEYLIKLNYEIEGLLHLALTRGSDTPQTVWELISEKAASLNNAVNGQSTETLTESELVTAEAVPEPELPDAQPVPESELPEAEAVPEPELPEAEAVPESELPDAQPVPEAELPDAQPVPEAELPEAQPVPESELPEAQPVPESELPEAQPVPEPELPDAQPVPEAELPEAEAVPEPELPKAAPDVPAATDKPAKETGQLRLDEKLALQNSRNLRKAFSINDRFRFRRELFGNSNEKMDEALTHTESMTSIDEARYYFYDYIGIDPESQDSADFMAIIENHILSK